MTGAVLNLGGRAGEPLIAAGDWVPLGYLNLYRLVLSGLFAALSVIDVAPRPLGSQDPALFGYTSVVYLLITVGLGAALRRRRPGFEAQLLVATLTDIAALSLLMFASGGVNSGFGMLVVVAVAGGSILSHGRIAFLFAASASLAVLVQQLVLGLERWMPVSDYTHSGILGFAFFATAALAVVSARRIRASESLVEQHAVDLANLAQLNDHIIQRMQSGVMVVDDDGRVRLMNGSAQALLGWSRAAGHDLLDDVAPRVGALLSGWRQETDRSSYMYRSVPAGVDLMVSFAALGARSTDGVVVFMEDASKMYQRAQQLKLASLGRLTASIAHEIRNPLGAISHAGELLAENPALGRSEARLTEIIKTNTRRVNEIIENVLQLSRRRPANPQHFELGTWLAQFEADFLAETPAACELALDVEPADLAVRFDPGQLRQVLWNLCENGIRHGPDDPRIALSARVSPDSNRPYLDVQDNGPGLGPEHAAHVFEPFFTTRADGSGLGLYIARELCESNQADLALRPDGPGACFRVTFADPRRQGLAA